MVTTIQVTEEVLHMLKQLREETHASSYNAALRTLLKPKQPSLAGFLGKKQVTQEEIRALRDKDD